MEEDRILICAECGSKLVAYADDDNFIIEPCQECMDDAFIQGKESDTYETEDIS